jgi:type IV pilus assembly protein PilA
MKKKKNAFTLIELLAIIVILAIIAVITVPIILNIIENSRKGASIDSAYGYRDSIHQYYLSKSVGSTTDNVLATEVIKTVSDLETDGLTVSGDKPTEGWVQLNKGQVVDYSLKFGDYVVSLNTTTNTPESTKNGELKVKPLTMDDMCPGCKFIYTKSTLRIGTSEMPSTATDDYTDWTSGENSHPYFLGLIESTTNQGKIRRAFACGVEKGTPFCLGGYDTSKYSDEDSNFDNVRVLNAIFSRCNASASGSYTACSGSSVYAGASGDGYVFVGDGSGGCFVSNDGNLYCSVSE